MPDSDENLLLSCSIEFVEQGPHGPGFYYQLTNGEERADLVGPFADAEEAEREFRKAMTDTMIEMTLKALGIA